ncbi:MAG: sulfotransferase [Planctomycetales bacterium]|nr:sulfotransferase [Planctomycetales bacterium]
MQIDFLICSERSGSNLITRLLNAHSQICAPSTTHLFRLLGENLAGYGDLQNDQAWQELVDDASQLVSATLGPWLGTHSEFIQAATSAEHPRSLGALLRTLYEQQAVSAGKHQLFIKEIELFRFQPLLEDEFPQARYVYVVRDPRDMALSWKKSAAIRGGVVRAAQAWQRDQSAYEPLVAVLAQEDRVVQLTYEQLIHDAAGELRRVCEFLGVTFETAQLQFHERHDTQALATAAADFANLQQPLMSDNADKFRSELSEAEIQYVEAICGEQMQRFGYDCCLASNRDIEELQAALMPLEPQHKAAYEQVTESERVTRARWVEISQRIRQRAEAVR